MALSVGDIAPDFNLPGTGGRSYRLSEHRGRRIVLVFYPGDETPVCTRQLCSYNDELQRFAELDATVLAISAQDVDSHEKFTEHHGFSFPLLADVDKQVAAAYGVLGPLGFVRRSVVIIDAQGVVRYVHRALAGLTYRSVDQLAEALRNMQ
ncbi:MAG: peroxiredoxin [Ilumatobacteraceae bacterium]|jgi:peroxiredoxin Q/BCP|nr:peroxiredoxin [Actinomycetota bacterium]MDA3011136.1 peroxiredoxin [Actinomycetota bacterium]MDA3023939.1 peroxiredoxin [Actinomycetota bacterium]NBU55490.1 peroxiredoxin [Acidimicrobiia bacterium]